MSTAASVSCLLPKGPSFAVHNIGPNAEAYGITHTEFRLADVLGLPIQRLMEKETTKTQFGLQIKPWAYHKKSVIAGSGIVVMPLFHGHFRAEETAPQWEKFLQFHKMAHPRGTDRNHFSKAQFNCKKAIKQVEECPDRNCFHGCYILFKLFSNMTY